MWSHEAHLRRCLARADEHPQAAKVALLVRREEDALAEAAAVDESLPLAGEVLAVKALFDVAGWVTHAGTRALADAPPATRDAPLVSGLRDAGAVLIAQTNMTELAYGALGLNAHYGTPETPLLPDEDRVAGGSTSGGAVAVALGIADIALGSDTSGSIRIPAAFCGVAGFKPTKGRYPESGMVALSPTFDVPGIIAASANACRRVDLALTGESAGSSRDRSLADTRFLVPTGFAMDGLERDVAEAFDRWLTSLAAAGATIIERDMPYLAEAGQVAKAGGIIPAEAFMLHRDLLERFGDMLDPRVGPRIALGAKVLASDYAFALRRLGMLADLYRADFQDADADAVLTPTVPILPPLISELDDVDVYLATNSLSFRFTEVANRLDLPSISIPGNLDAPRPIGLLLTGWRGHDARLLDTAVLVEYGLTVSPVEEPQ